MTENLSLGKKGKSGEIDFSKIRSGIKKKELLEGVEPKLKSVFEQIIKKIDTNPDDNMLSREELQSFYEELEKLSDGDGNLSSREGRKYQLNGENIGRKGKDALFALLNKLTDLSKDVKEISRETVNGQEVEVIKYNDNRTERIFPDGSRIITVVNGKKTVSTSYDKDEKRREESVTEGDGTVTTSYAEDGETKTKEVFTNSEDNDRTTVLYENNTPAKRIVETDGKTMNYTLVEINGKEEWQLQNQTENVNGEEQTTAYEYNKNGSKSAEIITTSGKRTERFYESNGTIVEIIKTEGEPDHIVERDSEGNYTDKYMDGNAGVTDSYDAANTHLGQTRVVGEHTYNVKYDENGNTVGVIVQNGESIQAIANKFGVSVKDLIKANASKVHGKYPNAYFQVGEEIKIPRKMEADERALQGRKSREEAISDYSAMMERRAEEARQREHQAKLAERNIVVKGNNGYAVTKDGYGNIHFLNPQGEDITEEEFKKWCPTIHANLVKEVNRQSQQQVAKGNNNYYVTVDGNGDLHFFDPKGKEISGVQFKEHCPTIYKEVCKKFGKEIEKTASEKQVLKNSAQQIVNDLIDAASGWNDVDKIKRTIAKIDTPEELEEVNRLLQAKGYTATELHSSIEVFIRKEENHGVMRTDHSSDYLEQTVQKWINNGTLKGQAAIDAQARMAARVIFDGGDGFGTDCNRIKKGIQFIRCPKPTGDKAIDNKQAKAVYEKVNAILVKHRTFYGLGSPCKNLRDYCEGEMWESECRYLDGILAENNAIQGEQKAQAIHDLTEEAVAGAGTDIDYLKQAVKAINSREDRIAVEAKLREYCKKHNVKYQYTDQSPLQAILYDECDTFMGFSRDHKEIRKFNEMLIEQGAYNEQEIINIRAEQAALQILDGGFANAKDAVQQIKDPDVLEKVNQILISKCKKSLFKYLETELSKTNADLVKAELAANCVIDGKEAANAAYSLILNSDFDKRAMGLRAIRNAEVAKLVDGYLKTKGSSLAKVVEQFNKEKAEYKSKAAIWDGLAFVLGNWAEHISDEYRENTDVSDNMYIETSNRQQLSEEQKAAYKMAVDTFEATLNKMKADYQQARDSQGVVSGAINAFCSRYNIGTTRDEIEARIEHDTETLRLLKLAADGKLTKFVNGKEVPVSFEEVWKERQSVVITGNMGIGKAQEVNFEAAKVEKVAKKAQTIAAMDFAKDNIAICWDELSNAKTVEELAAAITDTLEKLSIMSGKDLSLEGLGYKLKSGVIVDNSGNAVPVPQLYIVVNQLKQGLSDVSKALFNVEIPKESNISRVNDILSKGYDNRMESFKQEFRDAFGQEVPDEMIENYVSTINNGMMVANIGIMIGAIIAAPFTGGGSLAVFTITAAASFGMNALENSTDADGYTNSEWTGDLQQALWDGALSAVGFKVGQFAESFARGSQIVSNQNKWISWLSKQPKGGLTSRLASIPRNQLGKVAGKAKEIANRIQAHSGKIGKNVLEAKKAQILAKNPGANLNSVEKATVLFARAEACGLEVSSDMAQSLVQTYCMTGDFDQESFLMALCMSLGANVVGHGVAARHIEQTPPPVPKNKETGTETLDIASSHGTAHPSVVNVGKKKADAIRAEIEATLNNPDISGEELARIRSEVEALSDRDLRRELLVKIDEKAKTLEIAKQDAFNDARTEDLQNNVNHIFEKHSELNATDVRVLREYINSTDDINVLNELKAKLRQKELTYGGVTADYKTLYNTIDERIRVLTPKPEMSNEEVKSYIYSMLNSDKGMVKEEVEQLLDYIKGVNSAEELSEISALVGKKKMIGAYKKQLKSAIDERTNALRNADETPKANEETHGNENVHDENPTPDSSYSVRDENGAVIHIDTADGTPVKAHVGDKVYDIKDGKFITDDGIEYKITDSGIERINSKVNTEDTPRTDEEVVPDETPRSGTADETANVDNPEANMHAEEIANEFNKKYKEVLDNNYADIEALSKLTPEERKILAENLASDNMGESLLLMLHDSKPTGYFAGTEEYINLLKKLAGDKFDVITRTADVADNSFHQAFVINKTAVKNIIAENKELFTLRLGLDKSTSIDDIYKNLISKDGKFIQQAGFHNGGLNDITGLILGYPKFNTMIFELEQRIPDFDYQIRYYKDLTPYKEELLKVLYGENSPYKNMSDEFKAELAEKINGISEIKDSAKLLGGENSPYHFVYYVDEPSEITKIRSGIERTTEALGTKKPHETGNIHGRESANSNNQAKAYEHMNHEELFAEYYRLKMEVAYSPLSNSAKAANINEMKKISALIEQKGYKIEGDKLVKVNQEAPKSNPSDSEAPDFTNNRSSFENPEKAASLRKKLGDRLFTTYQWVEKGIESLKDITGYNKIKTIIANQFKNSPDEFRELIMRLNNKAKKIGLNIVENTIDRTARMGKSLAKFYTKMENAIAKMTNIKQFNKILKKITTQFAGFYDDMKVLIDKLYARAKAIGLSVAESIESVYKRTGIKTDGVPLDKYKPSGKGIDMRKSHFDWMCSRKDLFGGYSIDGDCWRQFNAKDQHHGAWKMHLYSVSEEDWRKMCDVIIPYLKEHDIEWKTFNPNYDAHCLNGGRQQGKAFTIYPKSNENMAQIAKDLDYIIRNNKLETSGSHIIGDAQMGSTGRLFYRYEFNSKKYQDDILDLSDPNDFAKYDQRYDLNRGEGRHLANDMTLEDDIWRDFDPSDPNARPYPSNQSKGSYNSSQNITPEKAEAYAKFDKNAHLYVLQQGQSVLNQNRQYMLDLNNLPKLRLIDGSSVDLSSAEIKNKIASLQEGEFITIGRDGDIKINAPNNTGVSRHHILITRHNGYFIMKDVSKYGKTKCYSGPASHNTNRTGSSGSTNNAGSRGRISEKAYIFNNINELRTQMQDILEKFSENTQNNILNNLYSGGHFRCQKNGTEYLFVRRGNAVRVEEFDIQKKYNIKETKVNEYLTEKTYDINDINDIWWAISDKLNLFSDTTQNMIITQLSNGKDFVCRKYGIRYEFTIDNTGRITVKEFEYARYQYDQYDQYDQSGKGRSGDYSSENANPKNNAEEKNGVIPDKPSKEWKCGNNTYSDKRLAELEYFDDIVKGTLDLSILTGSEKAALAELLDISPEELMTLSSNKSLYRKLSIKFHPDKNPDDEVAARIIQIINNIYVK